MSFKVKEELHSLEPSFRVKPDLVGTDGDEQISQKIYNALKDDIFLIRLKQLAWQEYCSQNESGSSSADLSGQIYSLLDDIGMKEILKNTTIKILERNTAINMRRHSLEPFLAYARTSNDEPIDSIRLARTSWEQGINEELHAICNESKRPFTIIRNTGETNPLLEQNLSHSGPQDAVKFLFDSEDLLETGIAIKNFNVKAIYTERYMGLVSLNLNILSLDEITDRFSDLSCAMPQLGMDELTPQYGSKLSIVRHEEAEALCAACCMQEARTFMRRGVPPSMRCKVWRVALGLPEEVILSEDRNFRRLRGECDRLDLLTDELFLHDIQTVTDDPRFFVFEEELKEVVFGFSRDEWVRENCHYVIHQPIPNLIGSELPAGTAAPPCGIQPFLGFATYFAPLCYVFRNKASLYSMSRSLFCKLWCKLNVLTSDPDTLLTVCKTFECLVMQSCPQLFLHLVSIGVQPLKIAFPWIQLGFVGLLEMDQLLHLWDRVIGFMDPIVLAVAAASVFVYRSEALLRCGTEEDATTILMEGSRIHIVPLMQMFLFKEGNN